VIAIVDSGPLYAVVDAGDADHERSLEVLARSDLQLVIPALAIAEVTYIVGKRLGSWVEAAFLRSLEGFDVEAPSSQDWARIAELVEEYGEFPLGGTDASVIALAERLGTDIVITLDRRHFGAVRPGHCDALRLLPE
jgi:predicted nucleic acid-binding protein